MIYIHQIYSILLPMQSNIDDRPEIEKSEDHNSRDRL